MAQPTSHKQPTIFCQLCPPLLAACPICVMLECSNWSFLARHQEILLVNWFLNQHSLLSGEMSTWKFPKMGVPLVIINFNRIFPYKPTSFWGYPPLMETSKSLSSSRSYCSKLNISTWGKLVMATLLRLWGASPSGEDGSKRVGSCDLPHLCGE